MTEPPAVGNGAFLQFMNPLSAERAERIVGALAARTPATVIDLGCGWGELLLRLLAAAPAATGVGVDVHGPDLARGRANAGARDLADRVTFVEAPADQHSGAADVVISVGAYQAFGTTSQALGALRALTNPGGRLLFGAEFWERPPTAERLASMWSDATIDDCTDLTGLVDQALAGGFRPLSVQTATRGEWEEFESGLAADLEEWLLSNPGHPDATTVRARLDTQRAVWLRGHRDYLGFAYLLLGVPVSPAG